MANTIYDLGLNEVLIINKFTHVLRVPGGWIYNTYIGTEASVYKPAGSVFVPFDEEFIPTPPPPPPPIDNGGGGPAPTN